MNKPAMTLIGLLVVGLVLVLLGRGCQLQSRFGLQPKQSPTNSSALATDVSLAATSTSSSVVGEAEGEVSVVGQINGESTNDTGPTEFGIYVDRDWLHPMPSSYGFDGVMSGLMPTASQIASDMNNNWYQLMGRKCEIFVYPASRAVIGNVGSLGIYSGDSAMTTTIDLMGQEKTSDGEMARFVVSFSEPGRYMVTTLGSDGWFLLEVQ